jgi:hypothetical protein
LTEFKLVGIHENLLLTDSLVPIGRRFDSCQEHQPAERRIVALRFGEILAQSFTMLLPILGSGIVLIAAMKMRWFESLNHPLDGGSGLFGANKTWRGVIIHLAVATTIVAALHSLTPSQWIAPQYDSGPIFLGLALSGSYVAGELINSFIKRRRGIPAGHAGGLIQRFFDNVDGSLATGPVVIFVYHVPVDLIVTSFALGILTHVITDTVMRRLRLKQR